MSADAAPDEGMAASGKARHRGCCRAMPSGFSSRKIGSFGGEPLAIRGGVTEQVGSGDRKEKAA